MNNPIKVIYRSSLPCGEYSDIDCHRVEVQGPHLACFDGEEELHEGPLFLDPSQVVAILFDTNAEKAAD